MRTNLTILIGTLLFFILSLIISCSRPQACTAEARVCADGTSVGRSGPNCEFAPCPALKQVMCTQEQRAADYCPEMFDPVCASDKKTYGNACFACKAGIEGWIKGACEKKNS